MKENKLFMYKIIISDDCGYGSYCSYRGLTYFAKTRMKRHNVFRYEQLYRVIFYCYTIIEVSTTLCLLSRATDEIRIVWSLFGETSRNTI